MVSRVQSQIVDILKKEGIIRTKPVDQCMSTVQLDLLSEFSIRYIASILEELGAQLRPGANVLCIGKYDPYLYSCLAEMVAPTGKIIVLSEYQDMNQPEPTSRLQFYLPDSPQSYAQQGPFNAIYVNGYVTDTPKQLTSQLRTGGRLLIRVGSSYSATEVHRVDRLENRAVNSHVLSTIPFGYCYDELDSLVKAMGDKRNINKINLSKFS